MLEQAGRQRKRIGAQPTGPSWLIAMCLSLLCLAVSGCDRGRTVEVATSGSAFVSTPTVRSPESSPTTPVVATSTPVNATDIPVTATLTRVAAAATRSSSTPVPSKSPTLIPSLQPSATLTERPSPTTMPTATATATHVPISVRWGEVTISTYAYEQALYTDPEKAGHPYPLLHRDQVGSPRPRTYRVLIVRNEYLELTFMPEMGGRLYQCRYLPTGQELFYNNRTIKPTHWGPEDQGWWLAIGGMELALPVEEHGYVTAQPWTPEVIHQPDGSVTVVMTIKELSRSIEARVSFTLRPGDGGFAVRSTLTNAGSTPQRVQYWLNAMLAPGAPGVQPSLRFYYPASEVIVHSRGDPSLPDARGTMSWPVYQGRDLSRYSIWHNWLGIFAPALRAPFTAVYDDAAQLGLVRVFPPEVAKGAKLFAFGPDFGDVSAYTDDGSEYVEMWGGLTPTFWDYATLQPQASIGWEETWYVLSRSGGPDMATAQASLSVENKGNSLGVTVAVPHEAHWILRVYQGNNQVTEQRLDALPEIPFHAQVALDAARSAEVVTIKIQDLDDAPILVYSP